MAGSTLIIGDVHDKWTTIIPRLDRLRGSLQVSRMVFLGDLTNDWTQTAGSELREISLMERWIESARDSGLVVDLLVGNHDIYYLIDETDRSPAAMDVAAFSPGHLQERRGEVGALIRSCSPMAATTVTMDGVQLLATHAGLTGDWAAAHDVPTTAPEAAERINRMLKNRDWGSLYQWDSLSSPLWARPDEMMARHARRLDQIVGHTPAASICEGHYDGDRVLYCDTMSTDPDGTPSGDGSLLLIDGQGKQSRVLPDDSIISGPAPVIE